MMHVDMPTFENVVGLFSCRHLLRYVMESWNQRLIYNVICVSDGIG